MFLIIGLGSMGRRRIRCLQALGYKDIIGFDPREDRREEASRKHGIQTTADITMDEEAIVFVCTPPKFHRYYSDIVAPRKTFIEAGVDKLAHGTPSATMMYQPQIQYLKEQLPSIGKLINISYHCGQYLPDWHPYEKVADFYVAEVGAREMVAFELTWFCKLFGLPEQGWGVDRVGTEIEGLKAPDTYLIALEMQNCISSIIIDVVSRTPIRQLVVNGSQRQLRYDLNEGISEEMYVKETEAFLQGTLCNSVEYNNKIIDLLRSI